MILSHCHGSYAIVDHSRLHVTVFGRLLLKDCRQEHPHESAVLHKLRVRKMTAELSRLLRSIPNVTIDPDSYHGQSFISLLNSKDKTRMIKTSFKQANDIVPIHVLISDMFRLQKEEYFIVSPPGFFVSSCWDIHILGNDHRWDSLQNHPRGMYQSSRVRSSRRERLFFVLFETEKHEAVRGGKYGTSFGGLARLFFHSRLIAIFSSSHLLDPRQYHPNAVALQSVKHPDLL